MSERTTPASDATNKKAGNTREDLEDEVTAADDTGMVANEAELTRIEIEENLE